jgi:UDP-GlcNAc:undecaprenyl-phosphate/decaprenyl-phosphate GlcNAc-1-phosphate transferase
MTLLTLANPLILALLAFTTALGLSRLVVALVLRIGWVDKPNDRKLHEGAVPLAGGLMIMLTVSPLLVLSGLWRFPIGLFWLCGCIVFSIAFIDDRFPIRARYRFFAQLTAATLIALVGRIQLGGLGRLLGPFELEIGLLAIPITILGIVAATNAFNMMDGLDGLAGGVIASALFWLFVAFLLIAASAPTSAAGVSAAAAARMCCLLIGAIGAFLVLNQRSPWRAKASIFMGDSGSMTLGFMVVVMTVYAAGGLGEVGLSAVSAAWIMGLPIIDLCAAVLRRVIAGVTPMTPDRRHVHHLLLALGLPV